MITSVLAGTGTYHQESDQIKPWLGLAFAGILITLLVATRMPMVSRIVAEPGSLARMTLPHTVRVVGVVFLIVMALGHLPAAFALPAGLGDIAIGLAAPVIARRLASGDRRGAVRFHLLGIFDLVVAVGIGFFSGLGPYRPLATTPSTESLSLLPLALIVTVAVPLAVTLHVTALRRLHAATEPDPDEARQALSAAS
ncbi:MAG: hypothetical protein ACRDPK_20565 [Carbonactinosporaceae bacterium]